MVGYLLKVYCLTTFLSLVVLVMLKSLGYWCFFLAMGFSIFYFFIIKFNIFYKVNKIIYPYSSSLFSVYCTNYPYFLRWHRFLSPNWRLLNLVFPHLLFFHSFIFHGYISPIFMCPFHANLSYWLNWVILYFFIVGWTRTFEEIRFWWIAMNIGLNIWYCTFPLYFVFKTVQIIPCGGKHSFFRNLVFMNEV